MRILYKEIKWNGEREKKGVKNGRFVVKAKRVYYFDHPRYRRDVVKRLRRNVRNLL